MMNGMSIERMRATRPGSVSGSFVDFDGERCYKIANYDAMPAFFMTIVSSSDIWNYLWSNGGLTAGRINSDHAIFPYYTADKVSDGRTHTGPYMAVRTKRDGQTLFWEPFSDTTPGLWVTERNLYKNDTGSRVTFEEINHDLKLAYLYSWTSSERFGLVRRARIANLGTEPARVEILDGCRNILPACVTSTLQNDNSVLLDAYKRADLDAESGLGIFSVTSIVTDKAEPSEGLFANVGWFTVEGDVCLSPDAVESFRRGDPLPAGGPVKGKRPALFVRRDLELAAGAGDGWYQVFDTSLDLGRIVELKDRIADRSRATAELETDISSCIAQLESLVADADGAEDTADVATCVHHKANVLFNIMRGGIFAENDLVEKADFLSFVKARNRPLADGAAAAVSALPAKARMGEFRSAMEATGNVHLKRLALEYLPLTFSRRHGDPSRPWNRFSIELKDRDGNRKLNYQGNWRDIFQNWEALAMSWPRFTEGMTAKFLNAMTADGFNPYRVTRDGIDWEVQEPDNPWSNIGYWGDHQVIYLAKLLELWNRFDRKGLVASLDEPVYSSGNVPYRIKSYADIVKNPRDTIVFDHDLHRKILEREKTEGSDARLVHDSSGSVALVSMTAKFVAIVGAKMANLVPGGGIWLNTQRPEWNDANNALAGWGLSVVTLCYLRRFLVFLIGLYGSSTRPEFEVGGETAEFFGRLSALYREKPAGAPLSPAERRSFMDAVGGSFETFRESLYRGGYSPKTRKIAREDLLSGFNAFLAHTEATIRANRRDDGLYHAYNTLEELPDGGMTVHNLTEMLEGQVAVLSSGMLSSEEALALLESLKTGRLFRADQYSYILYPEKELPPFTEKNVVAPRDAMAIPLLAGMLDTGDKSIVLRDARGTCHFNPAFRNARDLDAALARSGADEAACRATRELYEKTFNHRSFTGRSGTFYAYEGLGSIYWHMVSKLMLAVQEYCLAERDPSLKRRLAERYYDVRKGIGFNKRPDEYGAFPTDPYSHTPAGQGAKQPGMTGQVKEEILTRWGELGISVDDGIVTFRPELLRSREFRADGTLGFTWCGVRILYRLASGDGKPGISAVIDGTERRVGGESLDRDVSSRLLSRDGSVECITVVTRPGMAG